MVVLSQHANSLNNELRFLSAAEGLELFAKKFPQSICFSTSFSMEDQVITHLISQQKLGISIFTLDTGRLFPETYKVWDDTILQLEVSIKAYHPDKDELQHYVTANGPNAFYRSAALRKKCCALRKVNPLKRALENQKVWITGVRTSQSINRENFAIVQWDSTQEVIKYNPLLHWTSEEVKKYIQEHNLPHNPLHDQGYLSIGCAPCTRAILEGEDERAGRWWWEEDNKKECGLHGEQHISKIKSL